MATTTNPLVQVHGELLALQIVVSRLLGQMAINSAHNVQAVMRAEHRQASVQLSQTNIPQNDPVIADEIRNSAQELLDDIYSVAAGSRIPGTRGTPTSP